MRTTDMDRRALYNNTMQEIDHGLWIGDIDAAREQSTERFDLVVTVCQDNIRDNIGCAYEYYALADDAESEDEWGGSCAYEVFEQAAERVCAALEDDAIENVLVHCHVGRNRSAAICAAVIAAVHGGTFDDALTTVKRARSFANPNDLMRQHGRVFVESYT